ncbi:MAG TPA: penicillin acylase family protein [Rhodothermales bacterium]|nr:penicillin acylase family protein [Rhodothermales bacterium]
MNRPLVSFLLVAALVVFLGVVLMWYLALGSTGLSDRTIESGYVSATSSVTLSVGIEVEAADESDAYYLLGYAQGVQHPWTLILLRQTALGRLGEWFGEPAIPVDRLTRSLGISFGARSTAQSFSADDRRILAAYARGVSDAFKSNSVVMNEQVVLFDVMPEPWEDWHAVAVERLFAWLSEPPVRPTAGDTAFAALQTFQHFDETLRSWLHLHGFEHSSLWSIDDSTGTVTQAQIVYGATSLTHLVPARLSWPGARIDGVSLLGTPILPFSTGAAGTNVILLSSARSTSNRFAAGYPDSVETRLRHERIVLASGNEHLVAIPYLSDRLFFSSSSLRSEAPSVSHWGTMQWAGLSAVSDWPAWRKMTLESAGIESQGDMAFRLWGGIGLHVAPGGYKVVRGVPAVLERVAGSSVFLALHPLGRYAARRFRLLADGRSADLLTTDVTSSWAEDNVGPALSALGSDSTLSPTAREAVDYLNNWDFRYNMASIGALIFDAWMAAYTRHSDPFPIIQFGEDSLTRAQTTERLRGALTETVDSLIGAAGTDLARWRLETLRTSERYSPVWSFEGLDDHRPSVHTHRYAPMLIQQPGHPTTIAWESGLFDYPRNSPAHVVARAATANAVFSFRPDYRTGTGLIARHVVAAPEELPSPFPSRKEATRLTFRRTN